MPDSGVEALLAHPPYSRRNNDEFLEAMRHLTEYHLSGCAAYGKIWPHYAGAGSADELPFLHVGIFKRLSLRTLSGRHSYERTLLSSSTSGSQPSQIPLDNVSSILQSRSSLAILKDFVGDTKRPLVVIDSAKSLRQRGMISARTAAAMSLRPLATSIDFLLQDAGDPGSMQWDRLSELLDTSESLLVYGFTSALWLAWADGAMPGSVQQKLYGKQIHFVHSGGWKKLEARKIHPAQFNAALTEGLRPTSRVVDYYGLVEQVGVIYPECEYGARHVPRWADIVIRDPFTLESLAGTPGQIQLMNVLAHGAPYHSVLTEDMGRLIAGDCSCGRQGKRFELLGRMPQAELRGCANV